MSETGTLVTVATPFCNTNLEFFKHCFESVLNQTIGFENIEWVITLHDTEREYIDAVKKMASPYPNISIYELYDDLWSPSSARNECLKHVNSKYVFFLDSDDYLYPEILYKLFSAMEEYDADIGSCREEFIVGTENVQHLELLHHRIELDQTKPVLVIDRNDRNMEFYYDPWNLSVHKMYRMRLFIDNNIKFNDEVAVGEDIVFNLECAKHLKRVLALMQYIGYARFLNSGSLSQRTIKGGERYLTDYLIQLRTAYETGLDTNRAAWMGMLAAARDLSAPGFSEDYVDGWRKKIAPYVDKFHAYKPSKILGKDAVDGIMAFCRSFYGEVTITDEADRIPDLLSSILKKNADTDIGRNHNFDTINTYDAFRRNVPLSGHDFYAPLIDLTTRIGEKDIFCKEPIIGYAIESETGEGQNKIPYTEEHLISYAEGLKEILSEGEPTFLLFESLPKGKKFKDNTVLNTITGATLNSIMEELSDCSYSKELKKGVITSPVELLFPTGDLDNEYLRLLFALLEPAVSQIVASSTLSVLDTMQYLEANHERLIVDIEKGIISKEAGLPEDMYDNLVAKFKASPDRAAELKSEFEKGFENIVPRIWPDCKRVVARGTGGFPVDTGKLKRYVGDISLNNGFLALPEAIMGRAVGDNTDEYKLLTDNAFFEFLKSGETDPVDMDNVQEGEEYEVIVTNMAGLYRYRTGYVIKIVRKDKGVPVFIFEYRQKD